MKRLVSFLAVLFATCVGLSQPAFASVPDSLIVASAPCSTSVFTSGSTVARRTAHVDSSVRVIRAALPASVSRVPATAPDPSGRQLLVVSLLGIAMMGTIKSVSADKDTRFPTDTVRQYLNNAVKDLYYFFLNRPAWQVAAAAVAPPVCATATVTSQVKTTATTQLYLNGVPKSLTATDNLWTLTGANLAIGSVRRYLLLWDGTSATTVVSVLASNDQVIANFASAAAALLACTFPSLPAAGVGIVGTLSITNVTNAFVPATTLLGAAGVTAAYIDGFDDAVFLSALVTP